METTNNNHITKYASKLNERFDADMIDNIDNIMTYFNYCFVVRNNFFIENFSKSSLRLLYQTYNRLKSNILNTSEMDIFSNISIQQLKTMRYIFILASNNNAHDNLEIWASGTDGKQAIKNILALLQTQIVQQ